MTIEIPNIGNARNSGEVRYWLTLEGCPTCGERDIGTPRFSRYDTETKTEQCDVTCPKCGSQRSIRFNKLPEYQRGYMEPVPPYGQLGGAHPSQIISPVMFAKELARCMRELAPGTKADVATVQRLRAAVYEWNPRRGGLTCSNELAKFLPHGADMIPDSFFTSDEARAYRDAHGEYFSRSYIEACQTHFSTLNEALIEVARVFDAQRTPSPPKLVPLPPFSLAALAFHERWVANGDGPERQRMIAVGVDVRERNLSRRNLSSVILHKVTLDHADLSDATLQFAEMTDVSARESQWIHTNLIETTLRRCNFSNSRMTSALIHHSTIEGCDFSRAQLDWSSFRKSEVKASNFAGSDLTNARLHEAVFTDCDLRGAKINTTPEYELTDITFIRCDLRNTEWRGQKLVRATLIDCKIAGAHGASGLQDATITRPDVSPSGDGSLIGTGEEAVKTLASAAR